MRENRKKDKKIMLVTFQVRSRRDFDRLFLFVLYRRQREDLAANTENDKVIHGYTSIHHPKGKEIGGIQNIKHIHVCGDT